MTRVAIASADPDGARRVESALDHERFHIVQARDFRDMPAAEVDPSAEAVIVIPGPNADAAQFIFELSGRLPDAAILAVLPASSRRRARECLRNGALGVVFEPCIEQGLEAVVASTRAGQISMPRELGTRLHREPLSSRERQVLALVVMGFRNGEIASKLFLAESTVKSHLSSAFSKLGVHSRSQATALILDPAEGLGVGILTVPHE